MATLPTVPQPGDEITAPWGQAVANLLAKLVDPRFIQRGTCNVALGGSVSGTLAVTFPTPFANPPIVLLDRTTGAGTSPKVHVWAYTPAVTGFTAAAATGDGTTSSNSIACQWIAIDPAFLAG